MMGVTFAVCIVIGVGVWFFVYKGKSSHVIKLDAPLTVVPQTSVSTQQAIVQNPTFGTIKDARLEMVFLTAANGMTLYTYTKDIPYTSACYAQCATEWSPYLLKAMTGITVPPIVKGEVATAKRQDGTMQLTYKSLPLYLYTGDKKAGDTKGHKVGGVWFVAKL